MIKCGAMTLDHCDGREGKSVHHHPPSSIREEIVMKVGDSGQRYAERKRRLLRDY